eukprot:4740894-Pyramimonas_sp.AAC.1
MQRISFSGNFLLQLPDFVAVKNDFPHPSIMLHTPLIHSRSILRIVPHPPQLSLRRLLLPW